MHPHSSAVVDGSRFGQSSVGSPVAPEIHHPESGSCGFRSWRRIDRKPGTSHECQSPSIVGLSAVWPIVAPRVVRHSRCCPCTRLSPNYAAVPLMPIATSRFRADCRWCMSTLSIAVFFSQGHTNSRCCSAVWCAWISCSRLAVLPNLRYYVSKRFAGFLSSQY
ncbi:hypothetical protein C1752_09170 [Acaryochloris thomasi RCC1774]|uniref:Uncharacterized protein n=1 Tax=Acaryochloris thomasi RCC1774 TaxID=1764569 RepID=A0A2W1J901_9CYAN|nr:hypothetical protein C1752_09170 [Acaryochloris thomasi RCC1774]